MADKNVIQVSNVGHQQHANMTGSLHLQDCPCKLNLSYITLNEPKLLQISRPKNLLWFLPYLYAYNAINL
jgi:hypothetical protein